MIHRAAIVLLAALTAACSLVPRESFDELPPPAEPDYSQRDSWAALPDRADDADVAPAGESDAQATAAVDVFFIHPTTYYTNDNWNQPLDDEDANTFTDEKVLRNQASAFNAAARVYAPRYRQATLGAFLTDRTVDAKKALALAYADVAAAFRYYLENYNEGRPIIIASHSQGTRHAIPLLAEFFAGQALADRLVAAYTIGFALPTDHFERSLAPIVPCSSAAQTRCLVAYSTWIDGADVDKPKEGQLTIPYDGEYESNVGKSFHCTNPLSWTTTSEVASASEHAGAVRFKGDDLSPEPDRNYVTSARCDANLYVELPDRKYPRMGKNLHVSDYSLFYMDIRENALERAAAFIAVAETEL